MTIIAATYYRFDQDYLDDYRRNLSTLVDDFLIVEDTAGELMKNEGAARQKLYAQALDLGGPGSWVVVLDPDERIEKRAVKRIRSLIDQHTHQKVILRLNFRECYTPTSYRVDGPWGQKARLPIFPLFEDNVYSDAVLHMPKQPMNDDFTVIDTGLNIYHLKHINPRLRTQRKVLYNKLDPNHLLNGGLNYDYLDDESGMVLQKIPWRRRYLPAYHEYAIDEGIFDL